MEEITREEFIERFVDRMKSTAGFDKFTDGTTVDEYAREIAPTYWETDWQREEGPEECADADMSYWGE